MVVNHILGMKVIFILFNCKIFQFLKNLGVILLLLKQGEWILILKIL